MLKALALGLMLLDHIGFYFFPDQDWFRVLGRLCLPIWCFFIGYANTRRIGRDLIVGAIALIGMSMLTGYSVFPINILLTFILIRLCFDKVTDFMNLSRDNLVIALFIILVALLPSMMLVEYGTAALALAISGYAVRHGVGKGVDQSLPVFIAGFAIYALSQILTFTFALPEWGVFGAGLLIIGHILWRFTPLNYPSITRPALVMPLKWIGRNTLIIYVAHIVLFKGIAASFALQGHHWFAPITLW